MYSIYDLLSTYKISNIWKIILISYIPIYFFLNIFFYPHKNIKKLNQIKTKPMQCLFIYEKAFGPPRGRDAVSFGIAL